MAAPAAGSSLQDPKFIMYLFNPYRQYDCYVLVGNPKIAPPEKIGVVKDLLFAHSTVMRTDLQVSNMKEKEPIKIEDIFPHTFRNLLRFVYGYDSTESLCFDDADNLLYAAEKYMITDLKDKVATRLMLLLNTDNICSLLNNPACYQAIELNAMITKILRTETNKIFESPSFFELSSEAFVNILEQDSLKVKEIDVWRSAIKWAKRKANSDDEEKLRAELNQPLKRIRLCSLSSTEFRKEVVPTKVLNRKEIASVSVSIATKKKQPQLTEICNELEARKVTCKRSLFQMFWNLNKNKCGIRKCAFTIKTQSTDIEILSMTIVAEDHVPNNELSFNFSIDIELVRNRYRARSKINSETKTCVTFTGHNLYGDVTIPISKSDREVLLLSNAEYRFTIKCDEWFTGYKCHAMQSNVEHFTLSYKRCEVGHVERCVRRLEYNTVTA